MPKHLFSPCLTIILSFFLQTETCLACSLDDHELKGGFLPNNSLRIPENSKFANMITENDFNQVIDRLETLYRNDFSRKGANLKIIRYWKGETVNAYASRDLEKNDWIITLYGGLARHPQITLDGFALVICHELGHHIGGAPKKIDDMGDTVWPSNEGQSDYFATLKCLRRLYENDPNETIVAEMSIPPFLKSKCNSTFANANQRAICKRSAMAGLSAGQLFMALSKEPKIEFTTPDKKIVEQTYHKHPNAQCRLDTYLSGSICKRSLLEEVSYDDEFAGVCSSKFKDSQGQRPKCWHKE